MDGVGYSVDLLKLKVYSEVFAPDLGTYIGMSKLFKGIVIAGGYATNKIWVTIVKDGKVVDKRAKVILTQKDKEYYKPGKKIKVFNVDGFRILPIVCYEICFSDFWKQVKGRVDIITHHIGTPMYNEQQAERWENLQKDASRWFEAPLICSVGKGSGIDISGVIRWPK